MPQHAGFFPSTPLWKITATWIGIDSSLHTFSWVYYQWFSDEQSFDAKLAEFAKHPDYKVTAQKVDWFNDKLDIIGHLTEQSGPFITKFLQY